ncbi:hypothetical protein [Sphingomonas sp.]|jgi:hypothetical protein|uniref:hypothetical protein n=1 Tax=Sphingomonas sp. TaxID=28214 RepID=UPI002ED84AD5
MSGTSQIQDQSGMVHVEEGKVLLDGPAGTAVTMTPEAAGETGRRLSDAARHAGALGAAEDGDPAPKA